MKLRIPFLLTVLFNGNVLFLSASLALFSWSLLLLPLAVLSHHLDYVGK